MKSTLAFTLSVAALSAGLSTLGLTGCNKSDRADVSAKAGEMVADTKDAMSRGWDNVKTFTFEKRDDFRANGKAMSSKWDAQMSELREPIVCGRNAGARQVLILSVRVRVAQSEPGVFCRSAAPRAAGEFLKPNACR